MLTRQHAIAEYDFNRGQILPDRLTRAAHGNYLEVAHQLFAIYQTGAEAGLLRRQLHQQVEQAFEAIPNCPAKRVAAFTKLMDDASEYEDRNQKAAKLRREVFRFAAQHHPLVLDADQIFVSSEQTVKQAVSDNLNTTWGELSRELYSDVIEFHRIKSFPGYESPAALLARYNVAQVQTCLYRATALTIWAKSDLKTIVRLVKLSRLMHSIQRIGDAQYQFRLNGPVSALRQTRRYGVAMARMIPKLLACRNWRLAAAIQVGKSGYQLSMFLTSEDGLTSSKRLEADFDSQVEQELMEKWEQAEIPTWSLRRESELLERAQKIFTPDFVAKHESGRQIYVEVIGFWTPEYLVSKVETLKRFPDEPILIVAQEDKRQTLESLGLADINQVLWYKTTISLSRFRKRLDQMLADPG